MSELEIGRTIGPALFRTVSSSMSNIRSVADTLGFSTGLDVVNLASLEAAFSLSGEYDDSSKLLPLVLAKLAKRISSSCNRDCRAIESILACLPRSRSWGNSGYFSRSSASALPLLEKGRQAL